MLACLACASTQSTPPKASVNKCLDDLPEWVVQPRPDSPTYIYTIGSGTSSTSVQDAKARAYNDALVAFAKRITVHVDAGRGPAVVTSSGDIYGAEPMRDAEHVCIDDGYWVWLLVRYPRKNYQAQVNRRKRALDLWESAEKTLADLDHRDLPAVGGSRKQVAKDSLAAILAEYPIGAQHYFESEHVALRLAEIEITSGNPCAAKAYLIQVVNHTHRQTWADRARGLMEQAGCGEVEWSRYVLNDVFAGKTVGLSCCHRINGEVGPYTALYAQVSSLLTSCGATVSDLGCAALRPDGSMPAMAGYDLVAVLAVDAEAHTRNGPYEVWGSLRSTVIRGPAEIFRDDFPVGGRYRLGRDVCLYEMSSEIAKAWHLHLSESLSTE